MIQLIDCVSPVPVKLDDGSYLSVRCGKCPLCELHKKSEWTTRLEIEAAYHDFNSFVTLTYDDFHRPKNGIDYTDIQLFLKRLRKRVGSFRYFCANEYGSSANTFREHAHIIFFGSKADVDFRASVAESWPNGFVEVRGMVANDACCNYSCGYVDKKSEAFIDEDERKYRDYQYNVIGKRKPFVVMSRRPGLAHQFAMDNIDMMSRDFCFWWRGVKHSLSPYFVKICKEVKGDDWVARYIEYGMECAREKYDAVLSEVSADDISARAEFVLSLGMDVTIDDFDFLVDVLHKKSVYQKVDNLRAARRVYAEKRNRRII